jgi:hypothetical protein
LPLGKSAKSDCQHAENVFKDSIECKVPAAVLLDLRIGFSQRCPECDLGVLQQYDIPEMVEDAVRDEGNLRRSLAMISPHLKKTEIFI